MAKAPPPPDPGEEQQSVKKAVQLKRQAAGLQIPPEVEANLLLGAEDPFDPDAVLDATLGPIPKK